MFYLPFFIFWYILYIHKGFLLFSFSLSDLEMIHNVFNLLVIYSDYHLPLLFAP